MHEVRPDAAREDVPSSASQDPPTPPPDGGEVTRTPPTVADSAARDDAAEGGLAAEGPRPVGVEVRPTGQDEVDAPLQRLADVDHLAVHGHQEVYENVHRDLRSTLAALDQHDSGS